MVIFVCVYPEAIWVGLSMLASAFSFHAQQLNAPLLPIIHSSMLLHTDKVLPCPFLGSRLALLSSVLGRRCTLWGAVQHCTAGCNTDPWLS